MKLTKKQIELHDEALAILSLSRSLTEDEVDKVLEQYHPGATNNVAVSGAFFTPLDLADAVAYAACMSDGGRYIDLCAGIGGLTWNLIKYHRSDSTQARQRTSYTALEFCPEYVEIGRKLMPEVTWICGNVFDLDLLRSLGTFDRGLSNPPFGQIKSKKKIGDWLAYKGVADLMIAEIAIRSCDYGAVFILPDGSFPYDDRDHDKRKVNESAKWEKVFPSYRIKWSMPALDPAAFTKFMSVNIVPYVAEIAAEDEFQHQALGLPGNEASAPLSIAVETVNDLLTDDMEGDGTELAQIPLLQV